MLLNLTNIVKDARLESIVITSLEELGSVITLTTNDSEFVDYIIKDDTLNIEIEDDWYIDDILYSFGIKIFIK